MVIAPVPALPYPDLMSTIPPVWPDDVVRPAAMYKLLPAPDVLVPTAMLI